MPSPRSGMRAPWSAGSTVCTQYGSKTSIELRRTPAVEVRCTHGVGERPRRRPSCDATSAPTSAPWKDDPARTVSTAWLSSASVLIFWRGMRCVSVAPWTGWRRPSGPRGGERHRGHHGRRDRHHPRRGAQPLCGAGLRCRDRATRGGPGHQGDEQAATQRQQRSYDVHRSTTSARSPGRRSRMQGPRRHLTPGRRSSFGSRPENSGAVANTNRCSPQHSHQPEQRVERRSSRRGGERGTEAQRPRRQEGAAARGGEDRDHRLNAAHAPRQDGPPTPAEARPQEREADGEQEARDQPLPTASWRVVRETSGWCRGATLRVSKGRSRGTDATGELAQDHVEVRVGDGRDVEDVLRAGDVHDHHPCRGPSRRPRAGRRHRAAQWRRPGCPGAGRLRDDPLRDDVGPCTATPTSSGSVGPLTQLGEDEGALHHQQGGEDRQPTRVRPAVTPGWVLGRVRRGVVVDVSVVARLHQTTSLHDDEHGRPGCEAPEAAPALQSAPIPRGRRSPAGSPR